MTACRSRSGYSIAPLFDFGQGMFQGTYASLLMPVEDSVDTLIYKPYMKSFKEVLKFFMRQGVIRANMPDEIDVFGLEFPDFNAAILLGLQCKSLNIKLKGVEKPNELNKRG